MKTDRKPDVSQALARSNGNGDPLVASTAPVGAVRTQTPYQTAMAVQVAREIKRVEKNIVFEASQMRESWLYSWKVAVKGEDGKATVEGETIDAAMVLARCFGNCTCPCAVVSETPTHWTFEAVFIDLETGFSVQRLYRQRKPTTGLGKMSRDRAEDAAFSVGVSKAQRNAILKAMPQWLLDRAREAAKSEAAKKIVTDGNVDAVIAKWRERLNANGIDDSRVEARFGKPWSEFGPQDVVTLKTIGNAIREGLTSLEDEFPETVVRTDEPPQEDSAAADADFDPLA